MCADAQTIGKKLLNLDGRRTDQILGRLGFDQIYVDRIGAHRRGLAGLVADLLKPAGTQMDELTLDRKAARVRDLDAQRQSFRKSSPVLRLDDRSGVNLVPRSIYAAIREQIGTQCCLFSLVADPADVEARHIQRIDVALYGQERTVRTAL